jgi:hypothetical protein
MAQIPFDDPDRPGQKVSLDAHPQAAVTPGPRPDTAVITMPDGRQVTVAADYRDVHVKLQAAAARGHESGADEFRNRPVS